jgi:hypothetical protein
MNKIITIIFCFITIIGFGQTNSETYRFSKDILTQIDKDTVAWKYQTGAAKLSFSGYYEEVLKMWEKNGFRKPTTTEKDSLYFVNSKKVNAKDYIIEQSKNSQIVIINEAHHIPKHRTFTTSLLKDLYNNGYRYLGLEALSDSSIHERKFPTIESGYYTKEPEFGNLISEALKIGYTLFSYEASNGKNGKEREIEQAENIQKFMESVPNAKVLIHCGYAHAFENEYPAWEKAMAGRLKDNMHINPFTIDQTMLLERSNPANNHLFNKLNKTKESIVLIDDNGQVFNGTSEIRQTDVVIIHPLTEYINNRPDWLLKGKKRYTIPSDKINNNYPILVLAYRNKEFENDGIPVDIIEILDNKSLKQLYLKDGKYTVVLKDKNYNIIENYTIEIK